MIKFDPFMENSVHEVANDSACIVLDKMPQVLSSVVGTIQ